MPQTFFALALASLTLSVALDAQAENLSLEGIVSHVRDGDTIKLGPIARVLWANLWINCELSRCSSTDILSDPLLLRLQRNSSKSII